MKVRLAYGRGGLETDFPDEAVVVAPEHRRRRGRPDGRAAPGAARAGRRPPAARAGQARPDRGDLRLRRHPAAAAAADDPGRARRAGRDRPARGHHRAGRDRHPPRQHPRRAGGDVRRARPSTGSASSTTTPGTTRPLQWVGTFGDGVPVWLNREWCAADVKITTGFVEPHFFAGFSGGPKMVAPGLAGLDTVLTLHDARRIGHPDARWGITEGNPVHDDVRAIAAGTGVDFALDVVLNRDQDIVRGLRRRAVRHAQGGDRDRQGGGDAPGRPLLRRGRHDQLRLPARPEPLPGGQGDERRGPGGPRRAA